MPVSFSQFPANWKLPLHWIEVDASMAGLPTTQQPILLVGIKSSAGSAPADVPLQIGTLAQAKAAFGQGS